MPTCLFGGFYLIVFLLIGQLVPTYDRQWIGIRPALWFALPGIAGFFGILGTAAMIVLINKPKRLVPPRMRDQPGLLRRRRDVQEP